jgi:hypothetical protein
MIVISQKVIKRATHLIDIQSISVLSLVTTYLNLILVFLIFSLTSVTQ